MEEFIKLIESLDIYKSPRIRDIIDQYIPEVGGFPKYMKCLSRVDDYGNMRGIIYAYFKSKDKGMWLVIPPYWKNLIGASIDRSECKYFVNFEPEPELLLQLEEIRRKYEKV